MLDYEHTDKDDWYDALQGLEGNPHADLFDEFGNYKNWYEVQESKLDYFDTLEDPMSDDIEDVIDRCVYEACKQIPSKLSLLKLNSNPDQVLSMILTIRN